MPADLSGLSGATSRAQQTMEAAYADDEDEYIARLQRALYGDPGVSQGVLPNVAATGYGLSQPEATAVTSRVAGNLWEDMEQERQAQQIAAMQNYTDILMTEPTFRIQESVPTGMYEGQPTLASQQVTLANEATQRGLDIQEWLGTLANEIAVAGVTGTYEGQPTLASQQMTLTNEAAQRALDIQEELGVRGLDIQQSLGQQRIDLQQETLDWLVTEAIAVGGASLLNTLLGGGTNTGGVLGALYTLLTGATFPGIIPTVTSWFTPTGTLSAEAQAALDAIWAEDSGFAQALQSALQNAAPQASTSLSSAGYTAGTIAAELANLGYGATDVATALANLGYTPDVIAAELANLGYEAAAAQAVAQAAADAATTTATTAAGTTATTAAGTTATTAAGTTAATAAGTTAATAAGTTAATAAGALAPTPTMMVGPAAAAAGTTAATAAGALAPTPTMMVGPAAAAAGAGMAGASTAATATLPFVAPELLAGMPAATGAFAAGAPLAATPLVIIAAIAALTMTLNPQIPREQREIERYERALGHLQEFGGSQESLAQHVQEAYAYGQAIGSLEYLNSDPATQSYAFLEYLASGGLNPAGIDVMGALGWQAGAYPDVNQMIADAGQWIMVSLPDQGGDVLMLRSDLEEIQQLGSQSEQGSQ